jgi:hypothetical protein
MNKELKHKYLSELQTVRQLVNTFDPSGFIEAGCPDDEYDALNQQILSFIYSNKPRQDIRDLILNEVQNYYGSPDLTVLEEPYKTQFYSDLDAMLDKLATITL